MNLNLNDFKKIKNAKIVNEKYLKNNICNGVSTDSRKVEDGNLFFALRGEKFDAHNFISEVIKNNVFACVVENKWYSKNIKFCENSNSTFVVVKDSTKTLGELAKIYREKFDIPIIAVAGSNGKTTTKEMISDVLKSKYKVLATEGNLNNHIGLPQMIFKLKPEHEIAVLEIGTNHPGELKYLCNILKPTDSIITNIGREHLEFFKNLDGVLKEEGEAFRNISNLGIKFVNGEDSKILKFSNNFENKIYFGKNKNFDFYFKNLKMNSTGTYSYKFVQSKNNKSVNINLKISGLHNVSNSLAALTIGKTFGITMQKGAIAINNFIAPSKRMEVFSKNKIIIINDSYNANPDSMMAAIETLKNFKNGKRKIAILGDMFELGEKSKTEHQNIGSFLNKTKIKYVFTLGELMKNCSKKLKSKNAMHFNSKAELNQFLKSFVTENDVLLFKGSRGMKMEEIISELFQKGN